MVQVMPTCISIGCNNKCRMRPFKGSKKLYREARCGVCMNLMKKYQITGPERDEILEIQNGQCAICSSNVLPRTHGHTRRDAAVVDHCHNTGSVRGILCGQCNVGLGAFSDNIDRLNKAISYLNEESSER